MNDVIFYEQLDPDNNLRKDVQLNYNEVELYDSYFRVWDQQQVEENNFLSIDTVMSNSLYGVNSNSYY